MAFRWDDLALACLLDADRLREMARAGGPGLPEDRLSRNQARLVLLTDEIASIFPEKPDEVIARLAHRWLGDFDKFPGVYLQGKERVDFRMIDFLLDEIEGKATVRPPPMLPPGYEWRHVEVRHGPGDRLRWFKHHD